MTVVNNCGDVALLLLTLHDFGQRAGRSPAKLCLKFPSPGTTPLIVREQTLSHVCTQRGRAIFTLVSLFVSFAYQIVRCWLERYFVVEFSDLYFRVYIFRFFGFCIVYMHRTKTCNPPRFYWLGVSSRTCSPIPANKKENVSHYGNQASVVTCIPSSPLACGALWALFRPRPSSRLQASGDLLVLRATGYVPRSTELRSYELRGYGTNKLRNNHRATTYK